MKDFHNLEVLNLTHYCSQSEIVPAFTTLKLTHEK